MIESAADFRPAQKNRDTIVVEDSILLQSTAYPGKQFVLRLQAPECARRAIAGSFVHIQCNPCVSMRRPLSIMRSNPVEGWIEVLFKVLGEGLRQLSLAQIGTPVSLIGPIGQGFTAHNDKPLRLLIGGGVGIPPMIFLTEQLLHEGHAAPVVLMGSEIPFPFVAVRSALPALWTDAKTDSAMSLLDKWGVVSRLASLSGFDGCHNGYVTELAAVYLQSVASKRLPECEIFACGPTPMLKAVAALARAHDIACQVSLEEFMACAVGGCAGCAVEVQTAAGPAMKRVCVDGPVFSAADVFD